jgi:lysozyme
MSWLDVCLPFTKQHEGCSLTSYWDAFGKVWTIGFGATGPDITEGTVWTQDQADADLSGRLQALGDQVDSEVQIALSDNQKAAVVDFCYNVGFHAFANSTMASCLNQNDISGASEQFARWNKAGGQVVQGLVNRRAAEAELFNTP